MKLMVLIPQKRPRVPPGRTLIVTDVIIKSFKVTAIEFTNACKLVRECSRDVFLELGGKVRSKIDPDNGYILSQSIFAIK